MCNLSMFNSFIKPNNKHTLIWAICEPRKRLRLSQSEQLNVGMFYFCLLHSIADDGFYIGYSADSRRRLPEHRQGASFATLPWPHGGCVLKASRTHDCSSEHISC